MARLASALVATVVLAACPASSPGPRAPAPGAPDVALALRVARAEAARGGGVTELGELATTGAPHERALALRGLGRIGGPRARAQLVRALADADPAVVTAAAQAIGVTASLDELAPAATATLTAALLAALARAPVAHRPSLVEALGRAGDDSALPALTAQLQTGAPEVRAAAAYALGRFGRRKLAWSPSARLALIDALAQGPGEVVGAALYAFAREQIATGAQPLAAVAAHNRVGPALAAQLEAASGEVRALAAMAIAKQNVVGSAHAQLEAALLDGDWRVAVEAMRALAGDKGDDAGRDAVAAALVRRFAELERGKATEAQVVTEGLRLLAPHAKRPLVATALQALARSAAASTKVEGVTYGWIECLALAAMARAEAADLAAVAACRLPDHLRLPLVAELVGAKVGPLAQRRTTFAALLGHADVRVRASAIGALASLVAEGGDADRAALAGTLVAAIGAPDPILAGAAIDAAPAVYEALGASARAQLDAAVIARARTETEPELAASVLGLVGTQKIAAGADACRAALDKHPVLAAAGRTCLRALGEADDSEREPAVATPPRVALAAAFAGRTAWTLETTRGRIVIALDPDAAPWAVAMIIALTDKRFYDGLEIHRVVPDFVVQGGDPTQSGWGGPGFTLPAEPSARGFVTGGVGIADAGRDSGGSQWFVMHAPAPHLDARYTYVGRVIEGANVADALLIGDRVLRATVGAK